MDPLHIKRPKGQALTVSKTGDRYDVRVSGGENVTADELAKIEAFIGGDPDGASLLEKLRARVG